MIPFDIVVAVDLELGIARDGILPWHLSGDLKHFKEITRTCREASRENAVIMGRKTWEAIPKKFQPLPERLNIVLTRNKNLVLPNTAFKSHSLNEALLLLSEPSIKNHVDTAFVIGGGEVFGEAIRSPNCRKIYMTHIVAKFDCDTFFPAFHGQFRQESISPYILENSLRYCFATYIRIS